MGHNVGRIYIRVLKQGLTLTSKRGTGKIYNNLVVVFNIVENQSQYTMLLMSKQDQARQKAELARISDLMRERAANELNS